VGGAALHSCIWLPVRQRVTFKLAVLVFKALHGLAPRYLADDCQLVTDAGRRHLRSSESATCALQRTNTRFGNRAFRVAEPSVWNSLPTDLRHPDLSLGQFRRAIKRFCLTGSDCLLLGDAYKCTYLLTCVN